MRLGPHIADQLEEPCQRAGRCHIECRMANVGVPSCRPCTYGGWQSSARSLSSSTSRVRCTSFSATTDRGTASVVRALAVVLMGAANASRQDWASWVRGGEDTASIDVTLAHHDGDAWTGKGNTGTRALKFRDGWERGGPATLGCRGRSGAVATGGSQPPGPYRRFSGGDAQMNTLYYSQRRRCARRIGRTGEPGCENSIVKALGCTRNGRRLRCASSTTLAAPQRQGGQRVLCAGRWWTVMVRMCRSRR